jgi:putative sigma-54 modulation protein
LQILNFTNIDQETVHLICLVLPCKSTTSNECHVGMIMVKKTKRANMDIIISSLGFKAGESLEGYVREKLDKLSPSDHIIRANVVLFVGPDRATPNTYCEIILEIPGNDLFVKEHSAEFEQAVDAAVNKLQGMIRKAKEKQVDQWQGKAK